MQMQKSLLRTRAHRRPRTLHADRCGTDGTWTIKDQRAPSTHAPDGPKRAIDEAGTGERGPPTGRNWPSHTKLFLVGRRRRAQDAGIAGAPITPGSPKSKTPARQKARAKKHKQHVKGTKGAQEEAVRRAGVERHTGT